MSSTILKEAERVMGICNACRYCEGFCAVFPAMELRRTFSDQDLKYLSSLCHNCRNCYYACQYAPPHEFALNVPRALAELRLETYREFCWPAKLNYMFRRNGLTIALISILSAAVVLLLTLCFRGSEVLFSTQTGANAFYRVIPYPAMVLSFLVLVIYILASLGKSAGNFWRNTGGQREDLFNLRVYLLAAWDVLRLKYLDGGGYGCNYPDDRFSMIRRYFHHAVFYGFMLCLAATTIAAFYDHFLKQPAPYPLWSWPVMLGTLGGLALLVGTGGLLYLKRQMNPLPTTPSAFGMDVGFTTLLFMTSLTGLLLLLMRATPAMGILLVMHLGMVGSLFITMPYGKFIHSVYRYLALVRNAIEQSRADR